MGETAVRAEEGSTCHVDPAGAGLTPRAHLQKQLLSLTVNTICRWNVAWGQSSQLPLQITLAYFTLKKNYK